MTFEPLEERRLLALTVTTNLDVVDLNDGVLSLREAIELANGNPGADVIEFDPTLWAEGSGRIVLTQGELVITDSLVITGAGADLLTIDASGNDPTPEANNGDGSRVFLIDDGVKSHRFSVEIVGMTLTGGDTNDLRGGAIHSREHLTVRESVITGNSVYVPSDNPTSGWGGGIQVLYGNLQVIDSVISNNTARRAGGGIDFNPVGYDASLVIENSTIAGNFSQVDGGGVLVAGDTTITNSKIDNNVAFQNGGGIAVWWNSEAATLVVEDSEITGNRAGRGGGIYSSASAVRIRVTESLIADNQATSHGGGIALSWNSAPATNGTTPLEIVGSTLSGNRADIDGNALDLRGQFYAGSAGQGMAATISASTFSNNVGGSELSANGSTILAIAERLTISDTIIEGEDQTGIEFRSHRNFNPGLSISQSEISAGGRGIHAFNANVTVSDSEIAGHQGHGIELSNGELAVADSSIRDNSRGIHAFNSQLTVTRSTIDGNKGPSTGGGIFLDRGSLQVTESTISNNVSSFGGGITFAGTNLGPLVIAATTIRDNVGWLGGGVLTDGPTTIVDSRVIDNRARDGGGGILARDRLEVFRSAVSGNQTTGTNRAGGGIYAVEGDLALIVDSSVSNNLATGSGGGIQANVPLQVLRSNVSDNTALNLGGGGIVALSGPLSVIDSTVSGNRAAGVKAPGGGIRGGIVTISQSTISNNYTEGLSSSGGGVNASQLSLSQSTVADNRALGADSLGGGLFVSGPLALAGSIVAGNMAGGGNPDLRVNSIAAANYSLISNTTGLTTPQINTINHGAGNQLDVDPLLGPLADNGGPTFADGTGMKTHALFADSPAIDAGTPQAEQPVAMYRFGEAAGATTVEDVIGSNNGLYHGVTLGTPGSPLAGGQAALFDGVDDFATVPATVAHSFSFSLWVKTAQPALSGVRTGLVDADAVNATPGFGLYIEGGRVVFRAGGLTMNSVLQVNNDSWHHIAVTRDAVTRECSIYLDGVLRGSLNGPAGPVADVTEWHIGRLIAGAGHFAGSLDELAVFDRALSAEEIARHAAAGVPAFDQRGEPHLRVLDGDAAEDIAIDIGAYERAFGETYTFVVDTLADELDGDYSVGDFSLREAIELANGNPGADVIEFDPTLWAEGPGRILLTMGNLRIQDAVTIRGPGAERLIIDAAGSDPTPDSTLDDDIDENDGDGTIAFVVRDTNNEDRLAVEISGMTLTGGDATTAGAISSSENLRLVNVAIVDNSSLQAGGIYQSGGTLTVIDSVISYNNTRNQGGGIFVFGGSLLVSGTVISHNVTRDALGMGGGIAVNNGLVQTAQDDFVRIERSVISQNAARGNFSPGGISISGDWFMNPLEVTIAGSTISENIASGHVAGIYLNGATATITDSTISSNRWAPSPGVSGSLDLLRGGILLQNSALMLAHSTVVDNLGRRPLIEPAGDGIQLRGSSTATLDHSIVARNRWAAGTGNPLDIVTEFGAVMVEWSLVGAADGVSNVEGSLIGTAAAPINPQLGPLAYNGGPVFADGTRMLTHALLPGSPAIEAGDPAALAGVNGVPEFDQRGGLGSRVVGGRIDIGAFESQPNPLSGDYNFDGVVDAADYSVWRDTVGSTTDLRADGSSAAMAGMPDGIVDEHDYAWWKVNFGNVLEQGAGGAGQGSVVGSRDGSEVRAGELLSSGNEEGGGGAAGEIAVLGHEAIRRPEPSSRNSPAGEVGRSERALGVDAALVAWVAGRDGESEAKRGVEWESLGCAEGEGDDSVLDVVFAGLALTF